MSSTYVSKMRILAGLNIVLMVLSFITAHSWYLQIITLGLGASTLILVFARLRHARRTVADNQSLLLPIIAISAAGAFIFRFFVLWTSSRPTRYADYMPEGGAPVTSGIALNTQFFQLASLGLFALLPMVFFVLLLTAFRGKLSRTGRLPPSRTTTSFENSGFPRELGSADNLFLGGRLAGVLLKLGRGLQGNDFGASDYLFAGATRYADQRCFARESHDVEYASGQAYLLRTE